MYPPWVPWTSRDMGPMDVGLLFPSEHPFIPLLFPSLQRLKLIKTVYLLRKQCRCRFAIFYVEFNKTPSENDAFCVKNARGNSGTSIAILPRR